MFPKGRGSKGFAWLLLAPLALCVLALSHCRLESADDQEENYVTVRLNDSLKRYASVDIDILAAEDTSLVVGSMWSGPLKDPSSIPSYRLDDGETRGLTIRVSAYDSFGRLALNMLITKEDGKQVVTELPAPGRGWAQAYEAWKFRRIVDIKLTEMGWSKGTKVRNFPLLIRLNENTFPFQKAAESGKDLRFSTLDGKPLAYEISRWERSDYKWGAEVWVKVDSLGAELSKAGIAMYWGNDAAASESDGAAVFASGDGFGSVLHLAEQGKGDASEFRDATGMNHGTGGGDGKAAPKRGEGVVGYGQDFRPGILGGILDLPTQSLITLPSNFDPGTQFWTFQSWIRFNGNLDGSIFKKGDEWVASKMRFHLLCHANSGEIILEREGAEYATSVSLPTGQFALLGVVYNGNRAEIYVNGMQRGSMNWTQGGSGAGKAVLGGNTGIPNQVDGFGGSMDEAWFASKARSQEWMRLSYENQKPDSKIAVLRAQ